jgi:hypothetical protein
MNAYQTRLVAQLETLNRSERTLLGRLLAPFGNRTQRINIQRQAIIQSLAAHRVRPSIFDR